MSSRQVLQVEPRLDTETLDLGHGGTLLLLPIDSWVRASPRRICTESTDDSFATFCVDEQGDGPSPRATLGDQAVNESIRRRGPVDGRVRFIFELPIALHGSDEERIVDLVDLAANWQIDRVDGVGFRGSLPARSVTLTRSGASTGSLIVSASFADNWSLWRSFHAFAFLEVLETRPNEGVLREILQAG